MRLLFLSNYYPPRARGGYEQWCNEVAVEFTRRGHAVCVLTSDGHDDPLDARYTDDGAIQVQRVLHLEVESGLLGSVIRLLGQRGRLEQENLAHVRATIAEFQPDAALIWGMWNMPRSVPALVEELLGDRVSYYLCDYWPSLPSAYLQQWQAPARRSLSGFPKQILSRPIVAQLIREVPVPLRFENPICVSQAVRHRLIDEGLAFEHAQVIYGGTRIYEFAPREEPPASGQAARRLRLLYAGRVTATKGVHTAIRALALLSRQTAALPVTLDIVGGGDAAYEHELRAEVQDHGLLDRVHFRGGVPRAQMPSVLEEYDVLLLLSEWEEPFARIVLEAMAAGLVVIGTTTGGTGEILIEHETGLTFRAGDPEDLARQIQRLVDNPELRGQLARAGRRTVEQSFTFKRMVDQLEHALKRVAEASEY